MLGQMMTAPLTISSLVEHAARYHGDTEIVSVQTAGGVETTSWRDVGANAHRLGDALTKLGLEPQARCGTIAWNNRRHLEIYFGVSGAGFVCHTINPRLFPEQLVYIINHADDQVLFIDKTFVPLIAAIRDKCPNLKHIVLMEGRDDEAAAAIEGLQFYDDLIATGDADFAWPDLDENTASSLCYTSGTTGNPKGVLYSHRSTVLHSLVAALPDSLDLSATKRVLPVVPMFHVNAWGTPYACAMTGASMVLPGPGLDGASLVKLIDTYKVSVALGVPTIWLGLVNEALKSGSKLETLERTVIGGSACPPSMITAFRENFGVETIHAWGMTEMSPLGSVNQLLAKHDKLSDEARYKMRENQGRPPFGVELKIVDEEGKTLPNDGKTQGDLHVRGHWILDSYFRKSTEETLTNGWFDTGDVATLDADGYLSIKDRSKDIIKSGGEWISSVDLENIAIAHPKLADAAVIGARHEKWDERPVLVAVKAEGQDPSEAEILAIFEDKIAKWQIPDRVVFTDVLPRNATGKVLKRNLREEFGEVLIG
ncbi:long-chain-fatty-acid--CoA ligase [Pseudosulfitobacter pseudonitzschiae]|uniref:long-chain-fatty-acid--CoA ligase n=1 Tax=Pseudosulfitobacter pseudonitzschiae TaxID=1402135 RepID=UPI001AF74F6E|nr:long-chain-fatty-acid--CoA ligase [Pseudosulfitobacter pseudonitzschiae]MBM1817048.1 long-chain-fatty-acid--CoA ligase [Pseudosulfitobacter pseudonitzschiae]MBM1834051.1 long-chain-fatty-acid--CoA ligase [Pseudosulfitobacter pseudonitzschiae]MBM1838917.1 long-chain-fatty-acid--CoA ligase [Pseudosulfitobacter pseudonitzschiae]MBM1843766.1 long-chain-fatty-acid--CoA ligase [Pseudosulfitobacter pseudonitzschiae]MBM1848613.1 long-chain-fatty-acid--CoA ligase [Pseudosulfitobacter pseudonitzschia